MTAAESLIATLREKPLSYQEFLNTKLTSRPEGCVLKKGPLYMEPGQILVLRQCDDNEWRIHLETEAV